MLDQRREFDAFSFSGCLSTKGWLRAQTRVPSNLLTLALVLATPGCRRVDIQEAEKYPFLRAAVHRNAKELRKLIDQGSKVNQQQDGNRKTALHWVAELHDSNSARILLASGADVEMQDRSGRTALWYGAESLEMVHL